MIMIFYKGPVVLAKPNGHILSTWMFGAAAVVSSTLSVEVFLYTIEQFFRARDALGGIEVDAEVFNSLLEVIMTIKFDRLFEGIPDKCRILFNNLIPSIEERCAATISK